MIEEAGLMYILPSPIYFPCVWLLFAILRGFVKLFYVQTFETDCLWEKTVFSYLKDQLKEIKNWKTKNDWVDHPGWDPRRKQVCPDRRWTHEGGVVRSKLHSLETSKNARKSEHERTKVCRTHESLDMNAKKSENERTKVWLTHESLDMNARKSEHERTKVWWTHESLDMNARIFVRSWSDSRMRVWSWRHKNSCVHLQTKKLTFYACRCPLKMRTTGFHESTNPHIKSFLPEVHKHLYTNRTHSLFCYCEQNSRCLSISIKNKMNL